MPVMNGLFSIVIEPKGWRFEAPDSMPLLQAAQRSGVGLPSSCRNGTCRTCMCHLVSGRVRYNIEWPGLSAEEKRDGLILACIAYPESDLVIDEPRAVRVA